MGSGLLEPHPTSALPLTDCKCFASLWVIHFEAYSFCSLLCLSPLPFPSFLPSIVFIFFFLNQMPIIQTMIKNFCFILLIRMWVSFAPSVQIGFFFPIAFCKELSWTRNIYNLFHQGKVKKYYSLYAN
jgi:hypothetical protein